MFFPTEKPDTEGHNFRAGQVHLTFDVPKSKLASYRARSPSPLQIDPMLTTNYVSMNVTRPPLTDPRVRRALAIAIDRDAVSRHVLFGGCPAASTFVPPNCGGYPTVAGLPTDYAEARRLLAAAVYPAGRNLPAIPVQVSNDEDGPRVFEAIQAAWLRELGARITIEPYEQKTRFQNEQTLAYTLGALAWGADFADPVSFLDTFRAGNGNNWTGWSSPTYDRLLDVAGRTVNPAERFHLFQQAETLLLKAAPIAPLYFRGRTYLIHPAVENWAPSPLGFHRFQLVELRN